MATTGVRFTKEEVAKLGDEIYERDISFIVNNEQNKGFFVLIDVNTGQWEMDPDELIASDRMEARLPDAQVWMVRVGYDFAYRIGIGRSRTQE